MKQKLIGLIVSAFLTAGLFAGSYEMMMASHEAPKASFIEAFFGIASSLAFISGILAFCLSCFLLYKLIEEEF